MSGITQVDLSFNVHATCALTCIETTSSSSSSTPRYNDRPMSTVIHDNDKLDALDLEHHDDDDDCTPSVGLYRLLSKTVTTTSSPTLFRSHSQFGTRPLLAAAAGANLVLIYFCTSVNVYELLRNLRVFLIEPESVNPSLSSYALIRYHIPAIVLV